MPVILVLLMIFGWNRPVWSAATGAPALPASIRETLNQEYPGWALAPVTAQIRQEFKRHLATPLPSLTTGDFDQDGKKDYAVQIVLKTPGQEEQIIIVYLNRGDTYEETILQSMGIDPAFYLWVANKAFDETGVATEKPVSKDVLMVLGGPLGETIYSYDEGRFHEISLPDDSEHPDTSIPRLPTAAEPPVP